MNLLSLDSPSPTLSPKLNPLPAELIEKVNNGIYYYRPHTSTLSSR